MGPGRPRRASGGDKDKEALRAPSLRSQSLGKEVDGFWGERVEPVHGAGGGRDREVAGMPGLQAEGRGSLGQRPAPVHQVIL